MNLRVLIATVDDGLAHKYERFFGRAGFGTYRVESGTDCWAFLQQGQPDALILDEALPWGGDGVVARLREEVKAESPPVVLLAHPAAVLRQSFGRGLRRDDPFPVVARFSKSVSLPTVFNALLGGLRDFQREQIGNTTERMWDNHIGMDLELESPSILAASSI